MAAVFIGLLAALLTRLQIRADSRLRLTAAPRADRWSAVPTPSSGGLAIFLGCAAGYCLTCPGREPRLAMTVAALWLFGFLDDRLRFGPALKLAAQTAAAGFVVLGGVLSPVTPWHPINVVLNVFLIVMITNAVNMIDNMDGLCAGVVVILFLSRGWLLMSEGYRTEADFCAFLAAGFVGFLFFNYHPARIFMGDCGSLPAGFALAALTLGGPVPHKGGLPVSFFYPALTLAYPIFDMMFVSFQRLRAGRPIWHGGRDHSSHRLASLGLDQRWVVGILWLVTAFGAGLGIMIYRMPDTLFTAGALLLCLLSLLALALATLTRDPCRRRPAEANGVLLGCTPKRVMVRCAQSGRDEGILVIRDQLNPASQGSAL